MLDHPAVVFVIGLPGSGKTTVAGKMAEFHGYPLVTTEVVGAKLLSVDRVDEDRVFSAEESEQIYKVMYLMADTLLAGGSGVVVDGVFRSRKQRQNIFEIAAKHFVATNLWETLSAGCTARRASPSVDRYRFRILLRQTSICRAGSAALTRVSCAPNSLRTMFAPCASAAAL